MRIGRNMRKFVLRLGVLSFCLALAVSVGSGPVFAPRMALAAEAASADVRTVVDMAGRSVVLPAEIHRIGTLGSIGVLNALSAACWDRMPSKPYELSLGRDAFDDVELPRGGCAVVVGALVPMLKRLLAESVDFRVLEQDPRTLKEREMPHYVPADRASEVVPRADLLVVTGTTILNGTLSGLLEMARPDARVVVAGPTASMLPEAFFERGVDVLGGVLVTRPDELLDIVAEGGSGYHFFGRYAERMVIRRPGP